MFEVLYYKVSLANEHFNAMHYVRYSSSDNNNYHVVKHLHYKTSENLIPSLVTNCNSQDQVSIKLLQ